jgi:hypothetical protein
MEASARCALIPIDSVSNRGLLGKTLESWVLGPGLAMALTGRACDMLLGLWNKAKHCRPMAYNLCVSKEGRQVSI